jgi:DNA polymerase III delta subunit
MTSTGSLFGELKSGKLFPLYLLLGEDTGTKNEFIQLLKKRLFAGSGRAGEGASEQADLGTHVYFGDEAGPDQVVETLRTSSFFSPVRLVIVHGFDRMKTSGAFTEYLKNPAQDAVLVMLTDKKSMVQAVRKPIEAAGRAAVFWPMFRNVGEKWVAREIEKMGIRVHPDALAYILDASGLGKDELNNQLNHIRGYLEKGDVLTLEKAREIISLLYQHTVFDLTSALFVESPHRILAVFSRLVENGEDLARIHYFCSREIHKLFSCCTLAKRGVSFQDIVKQLGLRKMESARVRKTMGSLSMQRFAGLFSDLASLELLIKTHPRQIAHTAYQRFLAQTGGGKPARGGADA